MNEKNDVYIVWRVKEFLKLPTEFLKPEKPAMFAESSASDLFRKFMGNETNCSTNQMARKPMNVNKK